MSDSSDPGKVDIFKAPPPATNLASDPGYSNIDGMICRKKGKVSIDFCASCIEFEPAVKDVVDGDVMEGMDGIDPKTGNLCNLQMVWRDIAGQSVLCRSKTVARKEIWEILK